MAKIVPGTPNIEGSRALYSQPQLSSFLRVLQNLIPVLCLFEIVGEAHDIFPLKMLKPLPIIVMIIYLSESIVKNKKYNPSQVMSTFTLIGIMFSLVGDILLMINSYEIFMIGTCFFFIAHMLYVVSFRLGKVIRILSPQRAFYINTISVTLLMLYFINMYILWDIIPNLILFPAYGAAICFMSIYSLRRYKRTSHLSYGFTLIGAICFALSDNLLAGLKFNSIKTRYGGALVMLLYYTAQICLMHGSIFHDNANYSIKVFGIQWKHDSKSSEESSVKIEKTTHQD